MAIDLHNYERYIVDYLDGNLDAARTTELLYFLSEHPELENLPGDWDKIKLYPDSDGLAYPGKEILKKDFSKIAKITPSNVEEFIIASLEGDLDSLSKQKYENYKKFHPEITKQENIYDKLKLMPDETIVFPGKKLLKQPEPFYKSLRKTTKYVLAAAAILLFIILLYNPLKKYTTPNAATSIVQNKSQNVEEQKPQASKKIQTTPTSQSQIAESSDQSETSDYNKKIKEEKLAVVSKEKNEVQKTTREKINIGELASKNISLSAFNEPMAENFSLTASKTNKSKEQDTSEDSPSLLANANQLEKKLNDLKDINMWKALQMSFKGINDLTESDFSLETKTNENGKVTAFTIANENFSFSHGSNK